MSTLGAYFRLARVGWVLVREGVVLALPSDDLPASAQVLKALLKPFARSKAKRAQRSDRLATAVERLGPSYVKMGQFLATRPDVVGADFADDLASLQDRMAFFPAAAAKANIEGSLGRSVSELYKEFGDPIAAASIAQVHPAMVDTPKGPRKVAVKVIRPGVRQRFQNDLEAMYLIADLQQRFVRSARRLRPVEVTRTLEQTTKIEMDLRLEAAALSELAENTKDDPGFRVPEVDWERTGRDVVTMEWIDGVKMSDIEGLKAAGHDLNQLADTLIQSFLRHTLRDGFFHADMHPAISSWMLKARSSPSIWALPDASVKRNAASSPKSSTASSPAITCGWRKCISRPVMCRAIMTRPASPRRSAPLASRSTASLPRRSPWASC